MTATSDLETRAERLLRHVATDRLPVDSGAVAQMTSLIRQAHEDGRQSAPVGAGTVTYDLSDSDRAHVLTQALEDYRDRMREMAGWPDASASFARWADISEEMRAQAEAAGS